MSWVDKVSQGIIIQTADGETYTPKWMNASFQTEYQTSTFEFINVSGSLVVKTVPIGTKYNLEIYFDGPDHLETVQKFKKSCNDRRPWTVTHPLYDLLFVQVTGLQFDDNSYSVTKVTGSMLETIVDSIPGVSVLPLDQIQIKFESAINDMEVSLTAIVLPADIPILQQDNLSAYKKSVPIIALENQFEGYYNAYNTAVTYIDTATATPLLMMRSVMNVLTLPSQFVASVQTRLNLLNSVFQDLIATVVGLFTVSSKQLFQNKAGAVLSAMCETVTSPLENDFRNARPILETVDVIVEARRTYITSLDSIQSDNGGDVTSFVPDAQALNTLNDLVNTTITALFNLSLSARSERTITVSKDTNWILLAHQLYGLDEADQNINDLIEQNSSSCEEYVQVLKGRKVVYYV